MSGTSLRFRPRRPRTRRAVVLAGLPRSHQSGRRHRQRARGARRQSQAGRSRICPRPDPQERQDRLGAAAVLPPGVRRRRIGGAQIDLGDAQTMARGHLEDGKTTIAWNLPRRAAAEEPGQAAAEHAGHRAADHSARRHAHGRSGRRGRGDGLSRHRQRTERPHAAKYRRPVEREPGSRRSMPMRCSLIIRGCWPRPADSMWRWRRTARRWSSRLLKESACAVAQLWLTNGLPDAPDSRSASYLFVEGVLFQLLNQY